MIHYVISEVDMGEPIVVKDIPMIEGEAEEALESRIHEAEWELIVKGTDIVARRLRGESKDEHV